MTAILFFAALCVTYLLLSLAERGRFGPGIASAMRANRHRAWEAKVQDRRDELAALMREEPQ